MFHSSMWLKDLLPLCWAKGAQQCQPQKFATALCTLNMSEPSWRRNILSHTQRFRDHYRYTSSSGKVHGCSPTTRTIHTEAINNIHVHSPCIHSHIPHTCTLWPDVLCVLRQLLLSKMKALRVACGMRALYLRSLSRSFHQGTGRISVS